MPTQLSYKVTTSPFPLQASAGSGDLTPVQLTVLVYNETGDDVVLQGLAVNLPLGDGANGLTSDPTGIGLVPASGWTTEQPQYPEGFIQYPFQPPGGLATVPANSSLTFVFNIIKVNRTPGEFTVGVIEGSNNCQPNVNCPEADVPLMKWPAGWGEVTFWTSPNPPIVPFDGGPTLYWSGPTGGAGGATYTLEYYTPQAGIVNVPPEGGVPLGGTGQYPASGQPPIQLQQNTTFYLNVVETIDGQTYSAQQEVTATVEAPVPQITLFQGTLTQSGEVWNLDFQWQTEQAANCTLSTDPSVVHTPNSPAGGYSVPLTYLAQSYTLTAYGQDGGNSSSTLVVDWTQVGQVSVPYKGNQAIGVAVSPDGTRVYVMNDWSIAVYKPVSVTSSSLQLITSPVNVLNNLDLVLSGVVVSPDGTRLYLVYTNAATNYGSVQTVDAVSLQPIGAAMPVGQMPNSVAVSPDGTRLYVACPYDGTLWTFSVTDSSGNPLQQLGSQITETQVAYGVAVSLDSTTVYVGNVNYPNFTLYQATSDPTNPLKKVGNHSVSGGSMIGSIAVGTGVLYLAVNNSQSGDIIIVDSGTFARLAPPIVVGALNGGTPMIAVAPDGSRIYAGIANASMLYVMAPTALAGGTSAT